jgi:hypothetical protein
VICYNVLHCSQEAAPALVLECYVGRGVEIPRACADEEEEDIRGGSS